MGKTATRLGREFDLSARQMNVLLRNHGYLDGDPGHYSLTEKGQQYAEMHGGDTGYGGYAAKDWGWAKWDDATTEALKNDMEANPGGIEAQEAPDTGDEPYAGAAGHHDAADRSLTWQRLLIAGTVLTAVAVAAKPHIKDAWDNKVKPAARKVRAKFAEQGPDEAQPPGITEPPAGSTDGGFEVHEPLTE